jgi:hypothetical protein
MSQISYFFYIQDAYSHSRLGIAYNSMCKRSKNFICCITTASIPIHLLYADYDEEKSDKKFTKQADCGSYDGSEKGLQKTQDKLFEKEEKRGLDRSLNCLD